MNEPEHAQPAPPPSVISPGNHDGVHLGHRALISAACQQAAPRGHRVVVLTFDPHPARVLAPEHAPPLLTTHARRAELLRGAGADAVVVQPFDSELASWSPERFVEELLVGRLGARGLVVGPDFRFGRKRAGDVDTLRRLGSRHGFDVVEVPPVTRDGEPVSSSNVRRALQEGDVERAAAMLGRFHDLDGVVIKGDQRGRSIGFPTANLECDPVLHPPDGVYAVVTRRLEAGAPIWQGVANLGVRPTFQAGRSVEVHLLDVAPELYGARLRVGFVKRLRGEKRFDGLDALKAQIARDVESARDALRGADPELRAWL